MSNLIIENLKPAESPVDGGELLDDISAALDRHIIFASEFEPDAIALWSLGTYLMDVWQLWPKLYIYSPERECGKTSLLNAVEAFVKNAKVTGSITPSALYRIIEAYQPTILIEEADRFLRENEELNGIINAGHTRRTATKILVEKTKDGGFEPREFSLWGSQVIAGIGGQADTLLSRSIKVGLRRKLPHEIVTKLPFDLYEKNVGIRRRALCWAEDNAERVAALTIEAPSGASDRAQDNWTALFRLAQAASETWLFRCRKAYNKMEIERETDDNISKGVELLQDISKIIKNRPGSDIPSAELLNQLWDLPGAEWNTLKYGKPISSKWLARKLKEYDVHPAKGRQNNFYTFKTIEEAAKRYVPVSPE